MVQSQLKPLWSCAKPEGKAAPAKSSHLNSKLKVVMQELSSLSLTCQNPFLAHIVDNTFALESSGSTSSLVEVR